MWTNSPLDWGERGEMKKILVIFWRLQAILARNFSMFLLLTLLVPIEQAHSEPVYVMSLGRSFGMSHLDSYSSYYSTTQIKDRYSKEYSTVSSKNNLDLLKDELRLGYKFSDTIVIYGNFGYASSTVERDDVICRYGCDDVDVDYGAIRFGIGTRYLLDKINEGVIVPYGNVQIFTIVPTFDISKSDEIGSVVEDTSSFGLLAGGGLEYFVSKHFSVSGETGLGYLSISNEKISGDFSHTWLDAKLFVRFYYSKS